MLRALKYLGLALVCLVPVLGNPVVGTAIPAYPASARPAATRDSAAEPPQDSQAEQKKKAEQQIEAAENQLLSNIAYLEQLRSRYPNSPELENAISTLRRLLNQILQANAPAPPPTDANANKPSDNDKAAEAMLRGEERWRTLAPEAQRYADQGRALTGSTIASLNRSSAASPPPPESPPTPPPHETDRSPASAGPQSPSHPGAAQLPVQRPPTHANRPVPVPPVQTLSPAPPPAQTPQNPASPASDETTWFNKLQNGLLQYSVPDTMLWKVPSTVTVQILGEKAPASGPIDHQTGQAPIKVARRMKVLVSAPDNPDEFVIAPESDTQLEQYVPEDGPTTWHFSVTPRYTAKAQRLIVQAWVLYDANTQRQLPVYKTEVNVHVPGLVECLKRLFEGDPDYWLKYGLPGGAGFIFVSGLVAGFWKWVRKKKTKTPQPADVD
jgi:hypothetical protein